MVPEDVEEQEDVEVPEDVAEPEGMEDVGAQEVQVEVVEGKRAPALPVTDHPQTEGREQTAPVESGVRVRQGVVSAAHRRPASR